MSLVMLGTRSNAMTIRAQVNIFKVLLVSALAVLPFVSLAANGVEIVSPTANTVLDTGESVNITFTANHLNSGYANIILAQNGVSVVQIGSVLSQGTSTGNQTISYSIPWTVPILDSGKYDLLVYDGFDPLTNRKATVSINIIANIYTNPNVIQINPNDVVFNSATGQYYYKDTASEAQFRAQLASLNRGGFGNDKSGGEAGAVVGIVGDALINSAGQCAGTLLASQVATALGNITQGIVEPTNIPVAPVSQNAKNIGGAGKPSLDSIGYCIANGMIQSMGDSITNWINNDFQLPDGTQGSAYLKNPQKFFQNLADVTAGQFIGNFDVFGVNLCSPFSLKLRLNLLKEYRKDYRQNSLCTLTDIVKNAEGFANGNFKEGGWSGWFAFTQNPANNYYGAYDLAVSELNLRITSQNNTVTADLFSGNGFLSQKRCIKPVYADEEDVAYSQTYADGNDEYSNPSGNNTIQEAQKVQIGCDEYETVTPGKLIEEAANKGVTNPQERLVVSNSFDQVVTALVTTMMKKLFQGFSGATQ